MKFLYFSSITLSILFASCNKQKATAQSLESKNEFIAKNARLSPQYIVEKRAIIDDYFCNYIYTDAFSGSFLVTKNGEVIYEHYDGYANIANKKHIDSETPIHVASVGKTITAVGVMRLVDQGKINLDEKVKHYLPEFPYEAITVKHLLNHRAGLPYYGYFTERPGVWDRNKTIYNQDVLNLLAKHKFKLDFYPDTNFKYSNTNYVMLALIVEKVTGKTFQQALTELIFKPLNMKHTFVMDDLSKKYGVTQSYYANGKAMRWDYLDGTYGDKNIYTTPRDIAKMDLATYNDKFLSKKARKQMFQGYSYESSGNKNYGLGFRLLEPTNGEGDIYTFHNGWWRGNKTSYISIRKDTIAIICLTNKNSELAYKTKGLAKKLGNFPYIKTNED